MVELLNFLKFCNLLIVVCFWITTIDNYVLLGKKYVAINFIINTFILLISFILLFIRLYPEKIILDINERFINLINFILQFVCGIFMLGLSNISIGIGIICLLNSLFNMFVFIFIDNTKKIEADENNNEN